MYNVFTDEKRKKELNELKEKETKEKLIKERRQVLNEEYQKKYENRIKGFIMEMAQAKNPLKIKDYVNAIENSRKEFMHEELGKIKGRGGFVFKGFLTEKERINEYLMKRDTIYIDENYSQLEFKKNDARKFLQPQMRFKPRTDLERIYDTINEYSYGRANKEILMKQLKALDLNVPSVETKKVTEDEEIPDYNLAQMRPKGYSNEPRNLVEEKNRGQDILNKRKQFLLNQTMKSMTKRKFFGNSEARNIMKEYHNKTHFKGAAEIAAFKKIAKLSPRSRLRTNNSDQEFDRISEYNEKDEDQYNIPVSKKNHQMILTGPEANLFGKHRGRKNNKLLNHDEFKNIKKNPLVKSNQMKEEHHIKDDALNKLKEMSLRESIYEDEDSHKKKGFPIFGGRIGGKKTTDKINFKVVFEEALKNKRILNEDEQFRKKDDDKLMIDDITYLKSDLDLISKAVLKRCNFNHEKNKNNNKKLKKGDGKLMVTGGMTISEFMQKHISLLP